MDEQELKEWLEEYYDYFNRVTFIPDDPISVPHRYEMKQDIEIAGFLTAVIAWGQRPVIIRNATWLVDSMPDGPYQFIMNATDSQLMHFSGFSHRTFNGTDCLFFLRSLQNIYRHYHGLEGVFSDGYRQYGNIPAAIRHFRNIFFSIPFPERTLKHIPNLDKNAAAKRINMFLRWMVRRDDRGVDFGLWEHIPSSALYIPLDVHSGRVARELGLLQRKQNDWRAVNELTLRLRKFDRNDPVKYDYALFGPGVLGSKFQP
ncbi:MAG TPA: TIGR02757 family protein [Bacteroidales bacterium]|nr:TIGR02757 family protein [Bacteroidales bacterium]